jgi:y4mF family transcriptional regulator
MARSKSRIPYGKICTVAEIGALVRRRRMEDGVHQSEAAALAGVGTRFLSELERGKETAEIGKVLRVMERLGLVVWVAPRGISPGSCDG